MLATIFNDQTKYSLDEESTFAELSTLYEGKIEKEKLLTTLNQYLLKYSDNPYLHYLKGHTLYDASSYQEAIEHFELFISKGFYQGFFQKALCHQQLKNYSKALPLYNEALEKISFFENSEHPFIKFRNWIFPSKAQILNNRAAVNHNLKNNREAINDCTIATKLEPQYSNPYFMRGCLYNSLEKSDAALEDFKEAQKLNHNNPNIGIVQGFAEENANNFFPSIKQIATDKSNLKDTELQLFSFEHDLKEAIAENTLQISNLSSDEKYDSILSLAIHYTLTIWELTDNARKNDAIFGVMCFNIATVIAKHYTDINQYELFVDLTLYAKSEIDKQRTT